MKEFKISLGNTKFHILDVLIHTVQNWYQ